jgi:hypothetical protein
MSSYLRDVGFTRDTVTWQNVLRRTSLQYRRVRNFVDACNIVHIRRSDVGVKAYRDPVHILERPVLVSLCAYPVLFQNRYIQTHSISSSLIMRKIKLGNERKSCISVSMHWNIFRGCIRDYSSRNTIKNPQDHVTFTRRGVCLVWLGQPPPSLVTVR